MEDTIQKIMDGVPQQYEQLVNKAVSFINKTHKDHKRSSGKDLLPHLLSVAQVCSELKLDTNSIITAILHQSISSVYNSNEQIVKNKEYIQIEFGDDVMDLLESLEQINKATDSTQITNFKIFNRFLLATSKDIRPILIKVCDALDNARTVEEIPQQFKDGFCNKVLNVYAPLAEYLNMRKVQKELEESVFRVLKPDDYKYITNVLKENGINNEVKEKYIEYLQTITDIMGYKPRIFGRIKSKYSIYRKLSKYFNEGKGTHLSDIKDLLAFTIVVQKERDCFEVSNAIKSLTQEDPDSFDDYISSPKSNGYKALQITTKIPELSPIDIEIIVLTHEMYYINTYGPASHIAYKASMRRQTKGSDEYSWVEEIHKGIDDHINNRETKRSIPIPGSIFKNRMFVLTPQGRIIELSEGDTVLDFAYRVHTQIGHSSTSGIVNGKSVKLSEKVKSGDVIEIVTDSNKKRPSEKFLEYANSRSTVKKILLAIKGKDRV